VIFFSELVGRAPKLSILLRCVDNLCLEGCYRTVDWLSWLGVEPMTLQSLSLACWSSHYQATLSGWWLWYTDIAVINY